MQRRARPGSPPGRRGSPARHGRVCAPRLPAITAALSAQPRRRAPPEAPPCGSRRAAARRAGCAASVNFAEVTNSGLRGCGSSTAITCLMVPGRAENTATRSARNTASPRLWVTNTMVLSAARQQHRKVLAQDHAGLLVERAERLVHQQDRGLQAERTRERRALAHAAGQLRRIMLGEILEPDGFERARPRAAARSGLATPWNVMPSSMFSMHGVPREQGVFLEHESDVARQRAAHRLAQHLDAAGARRHQAADDIEERALAAAARADQAQKLAARDIERSVGQRPHEALLALLAELMGNAANLDRGLSRRHPVTQCAPRPKRRARAPPKLCRYVYQFFGRNASV